MPFGDMAAKTLLEARAARPPSPPTRVGAAGDPDPPDPEPTEAAPRSLVRWRVERRVPIVDALRGMAACAVIVQHSQQQHVGAAATWPAGAIGNWLGTWGVALFFVLSGFCVHLPQARREAEGETALRWATFARRRAWRLLPTHFAALVVATVAASFLPSALLSPPSVKAFLSHLFMVHTLSAATFASINAVLWTIAIELHFYATYPLLLRLRRALGGWLVPSLLGLGLLTYLLASLSPDRELRFVGQRLFLVSWWQWALGAALADLYVRGAAPGLVRVVGFRGAAGAWALVSIALGLWDPTVFRLHVRYWILPAACALLLAALLVRPPRSSLVHGWQRVGRCSYSLYLLHPVALALLLRWLPAGALPFALRLAIDAAAALLLAWVFFLAVERRFLNAPPAGALAREARGRPRSVHAGSV